MRPSRRGWWQRVELEEQRVQIFVSYARQDEDKATELHDKLTVAEHDVWFDHELRGGQEWWDVILDRIESSDLFIFVVSPDSMRSRACGLEAGYADALDRPIVPIQVRPTELAKMPDAIQKINVREFVDPDIDDWLQLTVDVTKTTPRGLPDRMPERPAAPIADLSDARELVARPTISASDQRRLVAELRQRVTNPDESRAVVAVLDQLKEHPDIVQGVAVEIDGIVVQYRDQTDNPRAVELLGALVPALKAQECTPILGTGMADWLFGPRQLHARDWAETYNFPMANDRRDDLPQVAQYVAVQRKPRQLRSDLADFYRARLVERFPEVVGGNGEMSLGDMALAVWKDRAPSEKDEPHRVLAALPCPIYVTAQATSLLAEALRDQGKEPVVDFCRWNPDLDPDQWPESPLESDPDFVPTVDRPLVYHVLGTLDAPDSIVITEDEYFDFLAEVSRNRELIPGVVREALADSSLLFVGFGLQDWDVRVLLRSLISRQAARRLEQYQHVAAQIDLEGVISPDAARRYIEKYFQRFREPPIDIFWSTVEDFTRQLATFWEREQ